MKKQSVYLETIGCQMNVADSERAESRLRSAGYELTDSSEAADIVIFNTCSIREKAEQKVFHRISEVKKSRSTTPLVGIMGCTAQLEGASVIDKNPSIKFVVGTGATERIPQILDKVVNGGVAVVDLGEKSVSDEPGILPGERKSKYFAFVPIIEGCNKFCTYCIVPYSRGRERSRPALEIVEEIRRLRAEGYKEVQLIGQNVNSYRPKTADGLEGFEGATPFSKLLRAVAATGLPRIKFTTSFPRDFHADIVSAIEENPNLCDWVHLPVQSGSSSVLRAMRRGYSVERYLSIVSGIKNSRRKIALTSDVIIGFPGETREDFEDTLRLVERCEFEGLYIFKYSERRGTPAANLNDSVSPSEKTERFLALERVQMKIQERLYRNLVGEEVSALVGGVSARSADDLTGHTSCNKVINFPGDSSLIGRIIKLRVTEAKVHSLYGEAVGV